MISTSSSVGPDRFFLPLALDRRGDQRRVALFAVFKQDAAELLAAPAVDHLVSGQLLRAVHAHIERRVLHVGKAALRMVELGRGHAQIEQDAVRPGEAESCEHLVDIAEIALDRRHALPHVLQTVLRVFERFVVRSMQIRRRCQTNAPQCGANGRRRRSSRPHRRRPFDLQRRKAGFQQNGYMMKRHTCLLPGDQKSISSTSAATLSASIASL